MNEFGVVNDEVRTFIVNGDVKAFRDYTKRIPNSEALISLIYNTKRYEFVPYVLEHLRLQFRHGNMKLAYRLYCDLLTTRNEKACTLIRKRCKVSPTLVIHFAVEMGIDVLELDPELCKEHEFSFFASILEHDQLPLFLKYGRETIYKIFGVTSTYRRLCDYISRKILEHEVANGHEEEVVVFLLEKCTSQGTEQELLLRSICNSMNYLPILTKTFGVITDSLVRLQLLLDLGVRPTDEQKETLRARNPQLYEQLFAEDV